MHRHPAFDQIIDDGEKVTVRRQSHMGAGLPAGRKQLPEHRLEVPAERIRVDHEPFLGADVRVKADHVHADFQPSADQFHLVFQE